MRDAEPGAPLPETPAPMALPNSSISPAVDATSPQTIFMTVDFPAPFFPTNP